MEQGATERLLCATLNGTELSPLGQAIRAQAVRAAAQLRAPSEALLRAMGAALCSLLGSPRPDVAYQGARCISSLLPTSPYISLHLPRRALHLEPARRPCRLPRPPHAARSGEPGRATRGAHGRGA